MLSTRARCVVCSVLTRVVSLDNFSTSRLITCITDSYTSNSFSSSAQLPGGGPRGGAIERRGGATRSSCAGCRVWKSCNCFSSRSIASLTASVLAPCAWLAGRDCPVIEACNELTRCTMSWRCVTRCCSMWCWTDCRDAVSSGIPQSRGHAPSPDTMRWVATWVATCSSSYNTMTGRVSVKVPHGLPCVPPATTQ